MPKGQGSSCIFCDIINGKADAFSVYEDQTCICILDIFPLAKGHSLVMPKRHVTWWHEMTAEETERVFKAARIMANRMMKVFQPEFVFMYAWGVHVPHVHIHLVPSDRNDILNRSFRALEKFQEPLEIIGHASRKEQLLDTARLLIKTEFDINDDR